MIDELRRQRLRRVIRDFFRNKLPGTIIEPHEIDAYHRRRREAAREVPSLTDEERES